MSFALRAPLSVQARLSINAVLVSLGIVLGGVIGELVLLRTQAVTQSLVNQTAALNLLQSADMAHEGLRSVVYESLLVGQIAQLSADDVHAGLGRHARAVRDAMDQLAKSEIDAALRTELLTGRALVDRYVGLAEALISTALVDRSAAQARLPQFNAAFDELGEQFHKQIAVLQSRNGQALTQADEFKTQAYLVIAIAALIGLTLTVALAGWTGRSIRRSLQSVERVASAVAGGELDRRAEVEVDDEIGRLGRAVNSMADKLQHMLDQALGESERHRFSRELNDALEMADSEPDAYLVVQRAMALVSPDHAMELLVSDSSHAELQRATEHPLAGAPGCAVDSPFNCHAVRRGSSVSFADSEALNACSRLRGRPGVQEPTSAVCVPLHFMGRAVGVLHATGPARRAMGPEQLVQLAAIGTHAAARIGVVRAFERTQLQAATDATTGLANRRALEAAVSELMRKQQPFALLMADLDRFKLLNDTYGHLVGDDALRLFADVMKRSVRSEDLAARWGGEEFTIVLTGSNGSTGCEWSDRARAALAQAIESSKVPKFTVSFGIADSTMAERLDDLLRIADEALYRSKERGRDRATLGAALAANELMTLQPSEHEAKTDEALLSGAA